MDEHVSSRMRWVEGTQYVDIFLDGILYSEAMTVGVESQDGAWASVLSESMGFQLRQRVAHRYSVGVLSEKDLASVVWVSLSMMGCDPKPQDTDDPIIDTDTSDALLFESPAECQDCHPVQFEEWEGSAMHAASGTTFAAFELAMNRITNGAFIVPEPQMKTSAQVATSPMLYWAKNWLPMRISKTSRPRLSKPILNHWWV